jgi:crotonobetaine/carnitine-CoA ligase
MLGYHDDPEATRSSFDAGWFRTGDLVKMDETGRVYYLGRLKDSIRRSGENVSAAEVEEAISAHPAVSQVAVVPVPDDLRGEEVRAFVVPQEGYPPTEELARSLREFCAQRLAYFKVPRFWTFRASLPLTASERVAKTALRDEPLGPDTFEPPRPKRAGQAPDARARAGEAARQR